MGRRRARREWRTVRGIEIPRSVPHLREIPIPILILVFIGCIRIIIRATQPQRTSNGAWTPKGWRFFPRKLAKDGPIRTDAEGCPTKLSIRNGIHGHQRWLYSTGWLIIHPRRDQDRR